MNAPINLTQGTTIRNSVLNIYTILQASVSFPQVQNVLKAISASPEAGLGADDEAAAVLVEVGELELWARRVVVRRDVHDDELGNNYLVKH